MKHDNVDLSWALDCFQSQPDFPHQIGISYFHACRVHACCVCQLA